MKKQNLIVIIPILILIIIISVVLFQKNSKLFFTAEETRGLAGDPTDVTLDFYTAWQDAKISTSSDPYVESLFDYPALSIELSEKLKNTETNFRENNIDPVLCQATSTPGFRSKIIFEKEDSIQLMILARKKTSSVQSVATLAKTEDLWQITDIQCVDGEQDPNQGEFGFDHTGHLLKDSLPPPLDNSRWHLIFEQDGVSGYNVPLFLSETSTCTLLSGSEEACREDMFFQGQKVNIKGDLTEAGLNVRKVEEVQ